MIKNILIILILCCINLNARDIKVFDHQGSGETQQMAFENAYWRLFHLGLNTVSSGASYEGYVANSIKQDFKDNFISFKNKYFSYTDIHCRKTNHTFKCDIESNLDLDQLNDLVKRKSNDSDVNGDNAIVEIKIALKDYVKTPLSSDFIDALQAISRDTGTSLILLGDDIQVGKVGNDCKDIERERDIEKKKGKSHKLAVIALNERLKECTKYKDMQYVFNLTGLEFTEVPSDSNVLKRGILKYKAEVINKQSGDREDSLESNILPGAKTSIPVLKLSLCNRAARELNSQMTKVLHNLAVTKNNKKIKNTTSSFRYKYVLAIKGLLNNNQNRAMKSIIKKSTEKLYNLKLYRNNKKRNDKNKLLYNFGSNEELDLEDLGDSIYDMADAQGWRINIEYTVNNKITIKFQ